MASVEQEGPVEEGSTLLCEHASNMHPSVGMHLHIVHIAFAVQPTTFCVPYSPDERVRIGHHHANTLRHLTGSMHPQRIAPWHIAPK